MPYARKLALRYSHAAEPLDDLVQVANLGLLNAIDRFDPARGNFVAFAAPTILGELRRYFRDRVWSIRVPRALHDLLAQIEPASTKLSLELQRAPSAGEIAEFLGVDVIDVLEAMESAQKRRPLSLDRPLESEDGEEQTGEWVGNEDAGYGHVEDRLALGVALPALDERQQELLYLRFVEDLTQSQIAERIGCSQVSRLLRRALDLLRETSQQEETAGVA
jgi:RNA polymerase sigma-B factor